MKSNTPKIIITLLASVCLFSSSFAQKEKERIASYIEKYKELAIAEMIRTGIPASITLAQGVLETGFGQSDLALNANNHFGIKCKSDWKGETVLHDDDLKSECFRKYASVEDSYKDHSDFLRTRPNYAPLFHIEPSDYAGWAYGLKKAGYATNPTYAERLLKVIEENDLQQYTLLAFQRMQGDPSTLAFQSAPQPGNERKAAILNAVNLSPVREGRSSLYPLGIFAINETKVMFAVEGTSLLAIANNHKISYSRLLEFNELNGIDIIKEGQLVFLEKKQKKGNNEIHIVSANETLYDICQKEGMQLSSVLELNNLQKGMQPAVGEKLFLKVKASGSPKLAVSKNYESSASM